MLAFGRAVTPSAWRFYGTRERVPFRSGNPFGVAFFGMRRRVLFRLLVSLYFGGYSSMTKDVLMQFSAGLPF
jgi:hypothetical protein